MSNKIETVIAENKAHLAAAQCADDIARNGFSQWVEENGFEYMNAKHQELHKTWSEARYVMVADEKLLERTETAAQRINEAPNAISRAYAWAELADCQRNDNGEQVYFIS